MGSNLDSKAENSQEEISLKEIFLKIKDLIYYLFSKWYILLIASVLGGGVGFIYAKLSVPVYTASSTFVLEIGETKSGLGQYSGVAAMMGIDLGTGGTNGVFQGDNLMELYRSRKMLEKVLYKQSPFDSTKLILDYYFEMNKVKERWQEESPDLLLLNFNEQNGPNRLRDSVVMDVSAEISKKMLAVGMLDKKTSIYKVDVRSSDENFSKLFNEELVKEVNSFYINTRTKKSTQNIEILQTKVDSVKRVMDSAIYTSVSVLDNTPNLNATKQSQRLVPAQKSQFTAETNKAILSQLVQNLELAKIALMKESPLIQLIDEPIYPLPVNSFGKIKGVVIGALLFGFIAVAFFLLKRILRVNEFISSE